MPEDLKIDRRTLLKTAVSAGAAAAAPAVLAADANAVRWSEVHDVVIAGAGGAGLAAAVLAQPGGIAFPILDANGYSAMRTLSRAMFDRALMRGDAFEANSIPELASLLQIPAEALVATVAAYNEAVETGHDPVGRRAVVLMHRIARRPFYGAKVTMCVNCTLGGIAITPRAEVLDRHGRVIPHLYAAGEVTGGVHGANYMGGNALSDVFTFGRIAGENAVQEPFA